MKILCVCYGNTCRSPMFKALLRREIQHQGKIGHTVESAGLTNDPQLIGRLASTHAVACMSERGIDITDHRSRYAGDLDLASFDLILVMNQQLSEQLIPLGATPANIRALRESEKGGIPNPYDAPEGEKPQAYRECAITLEHIAREVAAGLP